jgi:CheY-like chemotaxis protein
MNLQYKAKLLLVDDTKENLDLLIEFFSEIYDLSIALDGFAALERVVLDLPDLVLLDIMMPIMDGYEVCQKIKQNPITKDIPIIFLTSKTDPESIIKGFDSGAADYVTKPFNFKELQARVKVHIDLKYAREEMEKAKVKAEHSEKSKSEFLATMSHEIRTPMNGVLGMASLLMDTNLDPVQKDYVESLIISGETLLALINDILDFSKIESGKMVLDNQSFTLAHCIEDIYNLLATQAMNKGIELIENIDQNVPKIIIGDEIRLRQILFNLIGNAIKFTENGEIYSNIKIISKENRNYTLEFLIKDTGIGISSDKISKLFKSFSQLDSSTTRKYGGTGLGLAISKRLVHLMGGKIWVDSEEGKGASFFFTINTTAPDNLTDAEIFPKELNGKRILIVDSNKTLSHVIASKCKYWGMIPITAISGKAAFNALEKMEEETFVDIVVLDMEMPDINVLNFARHIKNYSRTDDIPIIFYKSRNRTGALNQIGQNIDSIILNKPFKESLFYNQLIQCFTNHANPHQENAESIKTDDNLGQQYPLKILVAEDVSVNQKVILHFLERIGYQADLAKNGIEAVEAMNQKSYDIIFMDIMMPEMDGVKATQIIRQKYLNNEKPWIIALTADAISGRKEEYIDRGMNDYISKPVKRKDLKKLIEKFLALTG